MSIEGATSRILLVDSGSFAHVCPDDFANHIPLQSPPSDVQARCADGRELVCLGSRKVPVILWGGQRADFNFLVMNIAKPLLSVSQLEDAGYHVHFGGSACDRYIEHPNGSSVSLRKLGSLYYLPVRFATDRCFDHDELQMLVGVEWPLNIPKKNVVFAPVGDPQADLTSCLVKAGFPVLRLSQNDFRQRFSAVLLERLRELRLANSEILVWCAAVKGDSNDDVQQFFRELQLVMEICASDVDLRGVVHFVVDCLGVARHVQFGQFVAYHLSHFANGVGGQIVQFCLNP